MERTLKPFVFLVFALALAVGAADARQPVPQPSRTPQVWITPWHPSTATPSESPSASPTATAYPASPTPLPTITPSPTPTPAPTPTILMLPPDAPPYILWYSISSKRPRAGEIVWGIVLTSSNVASVEIRVGGYSFNLPKEATGRFEGKYRVPRIPFFVSHRFTMRIIARNTAGKATEEDLQMQIH